MRIIGCRIVLGIEVSQTHEAIAHDRRVAGEDGAGEIDVAATDRLGEDAHAAEVEDAEPRMVGDEIVAGVGIGVEDAELEDLPPQHAEVLDRDPVLELLIDAGAQDVLQWIALERAHRQHATRRELRVRLRDLDLRIVGEEATEALEIRRLVDVVELLAETLFELGVDLG